MGASARALAVPTDCPEQLTLLELVRAVGEVTDDENEVVATVLYMLRSGRVVLCGSFRDEPTGRFSSRS